MVRPVYGHHLLILDEADQSYSNCMLFIESDDFQWIDPPHNEGGFTALKDRVIDVVAKIKIKAAKALGLKDGFTISSCVRKLKDIMSSIIARVKETVKTWTPRLREFVNTICNYIQDTIDYIKSELE